MIVLCVAFAVTAVLLFVPPPPAREVMTTLTVGAGSGAAPPERPSSSRWWLIGLLVALVGLALAYRSSGPKGAVISTALLVVVATCVRLGVQYGRARRASQARAEVAHACSLLASQIRVGRVPAEALRSAAEDCPVLAEASTAQTMGGDVAAVWRAASTRPGHSGLAYLARAWQVSTETGSPMARSLEQVSEALSADQALKMVVAAELAAPRATGKFMAVLPFCGLGLGYLLGGDPLDFLLSGWYGWVCLVLGVALAAAGVLWIDRLARQAVERV